MFRWSFPSLVQLFIFCALHCLFPPLACALAPILCSPPLLHRLAVLCGWALQRWLADSALASQITKLVFLLLPFFLFLPLLLFRMTCFTAS